MEKYTIEYNGHTYEVEAGLSDADLRKAMAKFYPELANATVLRDPVNKTIRFQVVAGTKGADGDKFTIEYNGHTYEVEAGLSDADLRKAMSKFYPELANATVLRDPVAKTIRFQVVAGTKGN